MVCDRYFRRDFSRVDHGLGGPIWYDADDQAFGWDSGVSFPQGCSDDPVGECGLGWGAGRRGFVDGFRVQQAKDAAAGDQPKRSSQPDRHALR